MARLVRAIVIGYGYLGKFHVQKIISLSTAELVAIVEPIAEAQKQARQFLETKNITAKIVFSIDELSPDEFDAMLIITPTTTHFELLRWGLDHQKHIFCEKPLTATYKQGQKIIDHLHQLDTELVVQVGHSERFHQCWDRAMNKNVFTHAEDILTSSSARVTFTRLAPFKGRGLDVGIEVDLMIHDLDLAIMLFNLDQNYRLTKVTGEHNLPGEHVDHLTATYERKKSSGAKQIIFEAGRGYHTDIRKIEIWADEGVLVIDLMKREFIISRSGKVCTHSYPVSDHLLNEQQLFFDSIINETSSPIDFEIALRAMGELNRINTW